MRARERQPLLATIRPQSGTDTCFASNLHPLEPKLGASGLSTSSSRLRFCCLYRSFSRNRTIFAQCLLSLRAIRGARQSARQVSRWNPAPFEFGNQRRDGPTLKTRAAVVARQIEKTCTFWPIYEFLVKFEGDYGIVLPRRALSSNLSRSEFHIWTSFSLAVHLLRLLTIGVLLLFETTMLMTITTTRTRLDSRCR